MRRLVLVLTTLCVVRGGARADDDSSLHITALAQAGWTDNLLSAPRTAPVGAERPPPAVEADIFLGIRPGVLATYGSARATHELSYSMDANVFLLHSSYSSLFHRLAWRGFFALSPRSEMITGASLSFGSSNLFPTWSPSAATVGVLRSSDVQTIGVDASEDYSYTLAPDLRLLQGLSARYGRVNAGGNGVSSGDEIGARLGIDKSFRHDALSFLANASFVQLHQPTDAGTLNYDLVNARGAAMYRRDLTRDWTFAAEAGAVDVVPTDGRAPATLFAVGSAQLGYFPAWGTANLSVRRDVSPNLLIAQDTVSEGAALTGWLPLPWLRSTPADPQLTFQTTIGYSRIRLIDPTTGTTAQAFDDVLGDVAVNWNVRKNIGLTLRYQLIVQNAPAEEALGPLPIYGFTRNTVLVQFFGRWPERLAVEVPVRNTLRVDRSNLTPIGDEIPTPEGNNGGTNK